MYMKLPRLVMCSTPYCCVYAAPAFTVISDCCFLGIYHSRQSTNKPDCYSPHQFSPDVIIPALPLLLSPSLPLPWFHFLSSSSSPWHFSFSLPFHVLTSQNSQHACLLPLRQGDLEGWSSEDDVLCCPPPFTRRGCIILYPQQFRRADAHWRQLLTIQSLLRCRLSIKKRH